MRFLMRAAVMAACFFPALLLGHQAVAHSFYSISGCCGGIDCAPLEAGDIRFTLMDDGTPAWLVVATGEVIPTNETRASPNRMNHRCVYLSGEKEGMTRRIIVNGATVWCLWTAKGSF